MVISSMNRSPPSPSTADAGHRKHDDDMKDMVSALTRRLVDLQAATKHDGDDDGQTRRIVTLAGTNTGATMRVLVDDKTKYAAGGSVDDDDDDELPGVYTNSNFQAINNSIMLRGSYTAKDPGVHMVVSDSGKQPGGRGKGREKHKGKKKERGTSDDSESGSDSDA